MDKLQNSFLKHILGFHQRSSNWAVRSETKRNSVLVKVINRMIGLWNHLNQSESPLIQDTLALAKTLHNEGTTSWFTSIVKISDIIGIHFNSLGECKNLADQNLRKLLNQIWYENKETYSEGKLKLYTSLKLRPGFEQYLNEPNPKLRQAITKIRISAHKFPIETGRFENKNKTDRICPLCCEGIGSEIHYLIECKNELISKTRSEFIKPFFNKWKGIHKLSQEELCKAILECQNDDMITVTGTLCLKIQQAFENEAL